jgi:hypothetical protein
MNKWTNGDQDAMFGRQKFGLKDSAKKNTPIP